MRIRGLVGAMALLAMAVTSASASAASYCVPVAFACGGIGKATLADAITAANSDTAVDDIHVGPGTFPVNNIVASVSNPVHISGAGIGATTLEGATSGFGITLYGADQRIADLTVHEPDHGHTTALYLDGGVADGIRADQRDNSDGSVTAVSLYHGASFMDGEALARTGTAPVTYGIYVNNDGSQDSLISGATVTGGYAINTAGAGSALVRFARITGGVYGVEAQAADTLVEESTVTGAPILANLAGGGDILATVRHVTLVGSYAGVESDVSGSTARMVVSNTAVVGGGPDPETADLYLRSLSGATGVLEADYSFFRSSHVVVAGAGTTTYTPGGHNVDGADAKLLDLAHGDLRPRFDSPLIDAGDPVPGGGEPMADLGGEFRAVNGRTDIGAYEYGRHTPTVTATVDRISAQTGETVTFGASVADLDPNELPGVTWTFDDGTPPVSGLVVTHSFATPGSHTATATATDPAGLTATGHASVAVTTPLLPRAALAPAFAFKKLRARKGFVGVRLSCPAVAADCAGRVELRLARKPKAKGLAARTIVLGRAKYAIANGTSRTVRVKLTRSARKRLRRARHGLNVKVVARPVGAASKSKTVRLTGR